MTTLLPVQPVAPPAARRYLRPLTMPASPINLAVLRITVFAYLAITMIGGDFRDIMSFAALPHELVFAPAGLGWIVPALPWLLSPGLVFTACVVFVVACVAAAVGVLPRWAMWTAALLSIYVLGIPQLFGKVNHMHFLVWFAVILAASPSADALAWSARRRPLPPDSQVYGFPLRTCWLLVGLLYFFSGLYKVASAGLEWAFSDNLMLRIYHKWWELGAAAPELAIGDWPPAMLQLAAAGTIAWELAFVAVVFHPRLRRIAVAVGVTFHVSTFALMRILFQSMLFCYLMFVDWGGMARRRGWTVDAGVDMRQPRDGTVALAEVLLVAVFATGFLGVSNGWPVAQFPTFAGIQQPVTSALVIEADVAGTTRHLTPADVTDWMSNERANGLAVQLLASSDERRLAALWTLVDDPLHAATEVRFYRASVDIRPPARQVGRELLATLHPHSE